MRDPRAGRGLYPTFNANYAFLRWPLDHLFVTPHFEVVEIDRLRKIGSDHFPVFFRVCLTERAATRKVDKQASPATEAEASKQVREGAAEKREEERGE